MRPYKVVKSQLVKAPNHALATCTLLDSDEDEDEDVKLLRKWQHILGMCRVISNLESQVLRKRKRESRASEEL